MRPTLIGFFIVGFGAMFVYWKLNLDYSTEDPTDVVPIIGCKSGTACGETMSICLDHKDFADGLCTKGCTLAKDCPGEWCCYDFEGKGISQNFRCAPTDFCDALKDKK